MNVPRQRAGSDSPISTPAITARLDGSTRVRLAALLLIFLGLTVALEPCPRSERIFQTTVTHAVALILQQ